MTIPGIQKLTDELIIEYNLLTLNSQICGYLRKYRNCASVVYHPRKMGTNDSIAGNSHTMTSIKTTCKRGMGPTPKRKKQKEKMQKQCYRQLYSK